MLIVYSRMTPVADLCRGSLKQTPMSDYLFTYGTLHPGHAPEEIAPAVGKLRPVGTGFVYGSLYDLGDYPGAVLDAASSRKISGTVFRLPEDENVLGQLDEYEGFDPDSPGQSLFLRTCCSVTLDNGDSLTCWIYIYNRKPETARVLASGAYQMNLQGAGTKTDLPA
jgi:gamma-glutamylcyclotransferase (GGCT)/AIG2-like uncharacterized protein YtfP